MKVKRSLRTKMIIIIAALTFVLLAVEGVISLTITQKTFKRTLQTTYNMKAEYMAESIHGWLLEYQNLVTSAESVVSASTSAEDVVKLIAVLEDLNDNISDVQMVYICFADGNLVNGAKWTAPEGFDARTRAWYQAAVAANGEFIYTAPYLSARDDGTNDTCLTLARYFKINNWEGVVAVDISGTALFKKITDKIEEIGEDGDYVAISKPYSVSEGVADGEMVYCALMTEQDIEDPNASKLSTYQNGIYLEAANEGSYVEDKNGTSVSVTDAKISGNGWDVLYISPSKYFTEQVNKNKNQVFVVFCICLVVAGLVSAAVGAMISKPIIEASKKVNKLSTDIANGQADLTEKVETKSKDELGVLVYGINELIASLGGMMGDITDASKKLAENVGTLKTAVSATTDNVSTISSTMEEMSASSEETSASTSQVTQQISDITALTEKVSSDTSEKTKEISNNLKNVDVLKSKMEDNDANMMKRLNSAIEALQEKIKATKKVEDIQKMTEGISDVASQTNLLSLNASIEAARAGEMGKGFAVVADEIGKLANNSAGMAHNIQEVSDEVLAIVEQLVKSAEEVSDIMLKIAKENSVEKSNLIEDYIKTLNGCYDAMSAIADNNTEIATSIGMIRDSVQAIDIAVEENAQGITSVAEGAGMLVTVSEDVLQSSKSVGEISDNLQNKISGYKY